MTRSEKLSKLKDKVIDELLECEELDSKQMSIIVTLLKDNKVIEEKVNITESDIIDDIIEEL